jgi:hypothetical protein
MDAAYLSALSALAGSLVGGVTSGFGGWLVQRSAARAGQRANEIVRREQLYRDFILSASKAYGKALTSNEPEIQDIVELYSMVSRMRVASSLKTFESAEKIMRMTVDTYFAPNKTLRELHEAIKAGKGIDPLKEFSETAREELEALTSI